MKDEKTMLIEVRSYASSSDIFELSRKAKLYMKGAGRSPSKIIMVTPFVDEKALRGAIHLE